MSWSTFSIRTHIRDALINLKSELDKSSYSDVIEYLIEFYRAAKGEDEVAEPVP